MIFESGMIADHLIALYGLETGAAAFEQLAARLSRTPAQRRPSALSQRHAILIIAGTTAHGGLVSCRTDAHGSSSPYELNINYFDALSDPKRDELTALQEDRFLASQAILLVVIGVPGIYFHSLFGSRGWPEGVAQSGRSRTINREKLDRIPLEAELRNSRSLRAKVFARYAGLLASYETPWLAQGAMV